jgi:hypothetical protein
VSRRGQARRAGLAIGAGLAAAAAALLWPAAAAACPCQSGAGPGLPVLTPADAWGLTLALGARSSPGSFSDRGRYEAFARGFVSRGVEASFQGAMRPVPWIEFSLLLPTGLTQLGTPETRSQSTQIGDLRARARVDLLATDRDDAIGLGLLVRAPTASGPLGEAGSASASSSAVASQGLGAWETGLALDLRRGAGLTHELAAVVEVALRSPDPDSQPRRQLGPRATGRAVYQYLIVAGLRVGGYVEVSWEGEISYDQSQRAGTGQRLVTAGALATRKLSLDLSVSGSLFATPPLDRLSANAWATAGLGLAVAYRR